MVFAYHIIFSAYGFWLPNDPRGSWSDFVASWELLQFGQATKTKERRPLDPDSHDEMDRLVAKQLLKYPAVTFGADARRSIARGYATAIAEAGYVPYAGAIMDDHTHLVLARHDRDVKRIVGHLKARATRAMTEDGCHPLADHASLDGMIPTPWAEGCWKVFLDSEGDIVRAIDYVEENPVRAGLGQQRWEFVTPYRK